MVDAPVRRAQLLGTTLPQPERPLALVRLGDRPESGCRCKGSAWRGWSPRRLAAAFAEHTDQASSPIVYAGVGPTRVGRPARVLHAEATWGCVGLDGRSTTFIGGWKRRRRSALVSTNTLESAIAAAAKTGFSRMPKGG